MKRAIPEHLRKYSAARCATLVSIADNMLEKGLGDVAIIHGSYAWNAISYVEHDAITYAVSDLDICIAADLSDTDCAALAVECRHLIQHPPAVRVTAAVKVSIQSLTRIAALPESAGMHRSAAGGLSVSDIRLSGGTAIAFPSETLSFHYALPYAAVRWLAWAGNRREGNIAALYELAKACGRYVNNPVWCEKRLSVMSTVQLRAELVASLRLTSSSPSAPLLEYYSEWLDSMVTFDEPIERAVKLAYQARLRVMLQSQYPSPRLRDRFMVAVQ